MIRSILSLLAEVGPSAWLDFPLLRPVLVKQPDGDKAILREAIS